MNKSLYCLAFALAPLSSACFGTAADEISVTLELQAEDARDLPAIASGATSLLGLDVPDSHGELSARVTIDGASTVIVRSIEFQVQVDGEPLEVRMVRQRTPRGDLQGGLVGTVIQDGDILVFHYRARALNDLVLPQGMPYGIDLAISWEEDTIGATRETGTAGLRVDDFVAATVNTGSFALLDQPRSVDPPDTVAGAGFQSAAEVTSGLAVTVMDARVQIVYFGVGDELPALGLGLIDSPAAQVNGDPAGEVTPSDTLEIYSSTSPSDSPAPYAASGTVATTGDVTGGKAVVTIELDYEPTDGTAGVQTDLLTYVADIP